MDTFSKTFPKEDMRILYIGSSSPASTSWHRSQALARLGHNVHIADPYESIRSSFQSPYFSYLHYGTGYRFVQKNVLYWISQLLNTVATPDVVWVDSGELLGREVLVLLKQIGSPVVLYNVDDPTGKRDGRRFNSLLKAISRYDLCVVVRKDNIQELTHYGANNVLRVYRSYDEVAHHPFEDPAEIPAQFRSEVAFVGTWMRDEHRDTFLLALAMQGIPISIWGDRWKKSPYWSALQPYYRGGSLSGREYVAAIQGAKLSIGLLSKGNRDLHTQRSLEIPFAGGLFCGERTTEHQALYAEGKEAVFWSDADECAKVCRDLLVDDVRREQIRKAGMQRVRDLKVGNEDICKQILSKDSINGCREIRLHI